jgi:cytochrome c oxidase cbb3-type subunit 4
VSYEAAAYFAKTWGLVILVVLFALAVAYALWPGNREKFRRASRRPLSDEAPDEAPNEAPDDGPGATGPTGGRAAKA